jgi:hypothetical protein
MDCRLFEEGAVPEKFALLGWGFSSSAAAR